MLIEGIGNFNKVNDEYQSEEIAIDVLKNQKCILYLENFEDDDNKNEFKTALLNYMKLSFNDMKKVQSDIYKYYKDVKSSFDELEYECIEIKNEEEIWQHIQFGKTIIVTRRPDGDKGIYLFIECECAWEVEHGLQIVFKNGQYINKVGAFDGHLTNSDAYDNKSFEEVVYVSKAKLNEI